MSNYNPITGYWSDEARKIRQAGCSQLARFHSKLYDLFFSNGTDPFKIESIGPMGRQYQWRLVSGFSGSMGNPDSGNSMATIGEYDPVPVSAAITQQNFYGRVTITEQQYQYFNAGGNEDLYFSQLLLKRNAIAKSVAMSLSAALYGTGQYGKVTAVTASLTVTGTGNFSLEVEDVQKMHVNFEFDVLDSDGSLIARASTGSAPYGVVVNNGNTTWGQGTNLVTFPKFSTTGYGTGNFTIPIGAIIAIRNMNVAATTSTAANNCFLSGLDEIIGNGDYPRNEGANIPVTAATNVQYTSFVQAYTSGVKGSFKMLDGLMSSIYARVTQSRNPTTVGNVVPEDMQASMFDEIERPMRDSIVVLMHPFVRKSLEYSLSAFGGVGQYMINPFELPKVIDPDIEVEIYKNMYIMTDSMCPLNRIFLVNPGSIVRCVEMELGALPGDPLGTNFSRIPTTLNYEMVMGLIANFFAGRRDTMAKATLPSGESFGTGPTELLTV